MLDINRILTDNYLMQVFTGLDRDDCSQLFPLFVQAYKAHYSAAQQQNMQLEANHTTTLTTPYHQLVFILFCLRWQPRLDLLSQLFGLQPSQSSWWINHLRPVLLQVYSPDWNNEDESKPQGQLQSIKSVLETYPGTEEALLIDPPFQPVQLATRTPASVEHLTRERKPLKRISPLGQLIRFFTGLLPKRFRHLGPMLLQASGVAAAIAIPGVFVFLQSRTPVTSAVAPSSDTAPQSVVVSPTGSEQAPPGSSPASAQPAPPIGRDSASVPPANTANGSNPSTGPDTASPLESQPYDDTQTTAELAGLSYYNHLRYPEGDRSQIVSIGLFVRESYEREEFLHKEAADAFQAMKAAAAQEGIQLIPISGFRTIERQAELFANQVEKHGSEAAAARLSAPPEHSEHHTGYAIDIGDANYPDADIKYAFENTPAYAWLSANALTYGFEESFPKGNQQGVSFEPWHWRYIESPGAQNTFALSKQLFP